MFTIPELSATRNFQCKIILAGNTLSFPTDSKSMKKLLFPSMIIAATIALTGCSASSPNPQPSEPKSTSSSKPSVEPSDEPIKDAEPQTAAAAATAYESFLNSLAVTPVEDIQTTIAPFVEDEDVSLEEKEQIVKALAEKYPTSFGRIFYEEDDYETASMIFLNYIMYVNSLKDEGIELVYSVPTEVVKLDGTTAEIDNSKLVVVHSSVDPGEVNEEPAIMIYVKGKWKFLDPNLYESVKY